MKTVFDGIGSIGPRRENTCSMSMIFGPTCAQYPRSPGAAGIRTYDLCGPLFRVAKGNQFWA